MELADADRARALERLEAQRRGRRERVLVRVNFHANLSGGAMPDRLFEMVAGRLERGKRVVGQELLSLRNEQPEMGSSGDFDEAPRGVNEPLKIGPVPFRLRV